MVRYLTIVLVVSLVLDLAPHDLSGFAQAQAGPHPLDERLDRDTFDAISQVQAAIDSESYFDAAKLIASWDLANDKGLAPYPSDPHLLVSLTTATRRFIQDNPGVVKEIRDQFRSLAQLRMSNAIQLADAETVQATAAQFAGTSAAALGHLWLGDRAMTAGWFATAWNEYQLAKSFAEPTALAKIALRTRLVAAMRGQDTSPLTVPLVRFGPLQLTKEATEQLFTEQREASRSHRPANSPVAFPDDLERPYEFKVKRHTSLDFSSLPQPSFSVANRSKTSKVDCLGQGLTLHVAGSMLLISQLHNLTAIDMHQGEVAWQSPNLDNESTNSAYWQWPLTTVRPLVMGQSIVVRQFGAFGTRLVGLSVTTGEARWMTKLLGDEQVISDPVIVQGRLLALTSQRASVGSSEVRLTEFDPRSGALISRSSIAFIRDGWWSHRRCAVSGLDHTLVACFDGFVLCCNPRGTVRWIRKQPLSAVDLESALIALNVETPQSIGNRLLIHQTGIPRIDCLDRDTGRTHWINSSLGAKRVLDVSADRLVAQTDIGFCALNVENGNLLWQHRIQNVLQAGIGAKNQMIYICRQPAKMASETFGLRLVLTDVQQGQLQGEWELPALADRDPQLSSLILFNGNAWMLYGSQPMSSERDLIQLVSQPAPAKQ